MLRTLVPIALIVFVLFGTWLIWPRADPRLRVEPPATTTETTPPSPTAPAVRVETAAPGSERAQAAQPAVSAPTASATRLVVQCVARTDKHPLAGVHVRTNRGKEELVTGADGRIALEVEPGRAFVVDAGDPEHFVSNERAEVAALTLGETRELRFEHDAGEHAHFCGLVVAREDGRPLAQAVVSVKEGVRATSDASGRFELDYAAHLAPSLRVDVKGFGPAAVGAGPGHESAEHARRIELDRAGVLVIAMQVPPGQDAVRVVLSTKAYELSQDGVFSTVFSSAALKWNADADAEGVCTFDELPPGVRLEAEAIGSDGVLFHSAEPIVLKPGEKKQLAWDLRGCELVGHVYESDGRLAPGVSLWLLRGEPGYRRYIESHLKKDVVGRATSAEDGSFRFASVSPGTWILVPEPASLGAGTTPADAIASAPLEVAIQAGDPRTVVDVRLARGLYIRGTLVAPDGTSGVSGYVYASSPSGNLHASTDAHGLFALGPLAAGTFRLEGSPNNTYLASLPVEVEAGAKDVVLRARPGAEVSGKVVDAESGAGVQAAITVGNDSGSLTMSRTQPDGSFRFDGLAPGRYTLYASTNGALAGELPGVVLDAHAPVEGLQVVLKAGATLRIRYEGSGVGSVSVRKNGALLAADGVEGGRTMTQVVPPGKLAVEFEYPGVERPEHRELEIAAGEARELAFEAPGPK